MARVKRGVIAKARHKKVLDKAKGYYGARRKTYRVIKPQTKQIHWHARCFVDAMDCIT